jgi:hypothetical protein
MSMSIVAYLLWLNVLSNSPLGCFGVLFVMCSMYSFEELNIVQVVVYSGW